MVSLLLFGIGAILMLTSIGMTKENNRLREICTEETSGIVTDYHVIGRVYIDEDDKQQDTRNYYPIIEYQAGGKPYTWQSELGKSTKDYRIGAALVVYYAPNDPATVFIPKEHSVSTSWGTLIFAGCLMAMGIFTFLWILIKGAKGAKPK